MQRTPNELSPEFLSINGLNSFVGAVSSSRSQMFGSHISQRLVIAGQQNRYLLTGMEKEFGKYTFSVKMPVDGRILSIHDRYRQTFGKDAINDNPQTIVLYEDEHTKEVGIIELPKFFSFHQYFGFPYIQKPGLSKIFKRSYIPKDTVFLDSPSKGPQDEYKYGIQLNMAYMSHPSVSEDGIMISRDVLPRLKFKTYERRVVEFGSKKFPLNLYGTVNEFKAFPDIGESIRDDGLLMAFRTYDPLLAPVDQSVHDIMEYDPLFDDCVYTPSGGKVIDIRIYSDKGGSINTPVGMAAQADKYLESSRVFYQSIINEWQRLKKIKRDSLQITPEFHRLVVEALASVDDSRVSKINKIYRMAPLDDYRIEFIIEYEITPSTGFKLTDSVGGVGV